MADVVVGILSKVVVGIIRIPWIVERWSTLSFWAFRRWPMKRKEKGKAIQWLLECESGAFCKVAVDEGVWVVDTRYRIGRTVNPEYVNKDEGWYWETKAVQGAIGLLMKEGVLKEHNPEQDRKSERRRQVALAYGTKHWDFPMYYVFTDKGEKLRRRAMDAKGFTLFKEKKREAESLVASERAEGALQASIHQMIQNDIRYRAMFQPGNVPVGNGGWTSEFYTAFDGPLDELVRRVMPRMAAELIRKDDSFRHVEVQYLHPHKCLKCGRWADVVLWEVFDRKRANKLAIQGQDGKVMENIVERFRKKSAEKCVECGGGTDYVCRVMDVTIHMMEGSDDAEGRAP